MATIQILEDGHSARVEEAHLGERRVIALDVLRHRILTTYEAEAQEITAEELAVKILEAVPVP